MERTNEKLIGNRIDWLSVITWLALVLFGWINIYSSVFSEEHSSIFSLSQRYGKQMLWIVIAIVILITILFLDTQVISVFSFPIYGLVMLLLVAVLLFGEVVNGSRSWFAIGNFQFQPAEFAKFAVALALAKFMGREGFKIMNFKNLTIISALLGLPFLLIMLQGDTGSAIVFAAFLIVLFREGLPVFVPLLILFAVLIFIVSLFLPLSVISVILSLSFIGYYALTKRDYSYSIKILGIQIGAILVGLLFEVLTFKTIPIHLVLTASITVGAILMLIKGIKNRHGILVQLVVILIGSLIYLYSVDFIYHDVLKDHQRTRINILFNLEEDNKGAGYNMNQSLIAIGSGGLSGKGFLKGTQTKGDFVPEQDTDFIFCTVGEEWGFWGSTAVVIIFTFLIIRILWLAERQHSAFSRIYGYAVASVIFFHFAVNIAMTIKLAPVIGIPLPFFSYGGSSLWAFTILLVTFIKLDTERHLPL